MGYGDDLLITTLASKIKQKYPQSYHNITLVFNDIDTLPFNKNFTPKNTWFAYEFASVSEDKILDIEMEKILNEALDNKIYTIPYGAIVEIKDPVFKYIQIYEELDKIRFFVF